MRVILYFNDGDRLEFQNVHNISTDAELFMFTYTDMEDCRFHNVSYCREQIDRISLREVGV